MKFDLKQRERLLVATLYFIALVVIYKIIGGDFDSLLGKASNDNTIWFFSGALMIVLGKYVIETYFTKPSDALANSIAVLAGMISLSNKSALWAYTPILCYTLLVFLGSIFCIATKDTHREKLKKASQLAYKLVGILGKAEVLFSIVYLSASYSYFAIPNNYLNFIIAIAFWVVLVFFDLGGLIVKKAIGLFNLFNPKGTEELGTAIGCENPFFYRVEIDLQKNTQAPNVKYGDLVAIETSQNVGSIGMVVDKKHLLSKRWLSIYLLRDETGVPVKIDLRSKKIISDPKSIFSQKNCAYSIELTSLPEEERKKINDNTLYKERNTFIGYVTTGSNISTINFSIIGNVDEKEKQISEGFVLKTEIYGKETLYQVINGNTKEEHLENFDSHGFVVGVARKLGNYDKATKILDVSRWVPSVYSPLFFINNPKMTDEQKRKCAKESIGHLPNTDYEIPLKDINSVVTHNTAVLGILGIGKSCLTFELIQKVLSGTEAKVVCFDITGEYFDALTGYGCSPVVLSDKDLISELSTNYTTINKDVHRGGNHGNFRQKITELLNAFFDNGDRLLIINPEDYDVSKQTNDVKPKKVGAGQNDWQDQAPMADLSLVEKTRIISEIILENAKAKGQSKDAKYLLVFEEAHSLVPEWNSVANKGDEGATNGIAKVILQGRKYGLGSLIITQRTANVSKSILNQCNTIFALRVFDDTGKTFLENYIGRDYADTLSTLEERHAIGIGKGLMLRQPVIIKLNDQENIIPAKSK
ncbi:hypothetical protein A3D42_03035 [Candidatus Nomurabacteria bacterium RIFCSPHIGHO2_02_FULL_41_18]|uniref:Helicase HerA central domain-containing protein n=1 Tax=Candidatus Nomurabacteria bacterium RIFCSPHIGHO2_02_FULL_41_18 TaxID=1801754 RepID=A0A1F6W6H6_9BACT|nr:MAG: hypothetical protein A3D42_03035 [Candidatus Nomurabacteria bacterium RIFCSPHIGHO2_02_FULL_41_18]